MKKLIDFEYDLWTTEEGKCMVRVRANKEECEVDRETFRLLRAEEKRLRRERTPVKREEDTNGEMLPAGEKRHPLSLQTICSGENEDGEFWLADSEDFVDEIITLQILKAFWSQLTINQQEVLEKCLLGGQSLRSYAREKGCAYSTVKGIQDEIRRKFKKFL